MRALLFVMCLPLAAQTMDQCAALHKHGDAGETACWQKLSRATDPAVRAELPPQCTQELDTVHNRHVPVEQHTIGQRAPAVLQRETAVLGLGHGIAVGLEDAPGELAHYPAVIDNETGAAH